MFSVIIPLYNKAPYVEKAIRSVLAQTYQEFELIVMDDGSKDESYKIAETFLLKTQNSKLRTQSNQGVSTARNNGVKLANYPYIAFLDADDWWAPTFLEEMKLLIEEFPEAGIYGSSYYIVKRGNNRIAPIGVEESFEKGLINYCQVYAKTLCMPLTSISVCISKEVFDEEKGFKPTLKLGEDFDLWVRVAMKYPVAFLNKPLAYYNQDVDLQNRAVGMKFYKPEEHMLFTDYGEWMNNKDFKYLYNKLAVYGLLKYYLADENVSEVNIILRNIDWTEHKFRYKVFYRIFPKSVVKLYFLLLKKISILKHKMLK